MEKQELLSHILCSIPMWRHVDGNRLQMAANHHTQALPLLNPEIPQIYNPYQSLGKYVLHTEAPADGKILDIKDNIIVFEQHDGKRYIIATQHWFDILVSVGETVHKGQWLAKPPNVLENGLIVQGRNATVAFNIYDGFTYEDAIVADESVVVDFEAWYPDIIEIEYEHFKTLKLKQELEVGRLIHGHIGSIRRAQFFERTEEDIFLPIPHKIHSIVVILPSKHRHKILERHSPQEREFLIKYSIDHRFADNDEIYGHFKQLADSQDSVSIFIYTTKLLKPEVGDKFTNRFGNKGVLSLITNIETVQHSNIPPFKPQFIFSPDGIRRMNLAQLGEMHYAYILKEIVPVLVRRAEKQYSDDMVCSAILKNLVLSIDEDAYNFLSSVVQQVGPATFKEYMKTYGLHVPIYNREDANYLKRIHSLYKKLNLPNKLLLQKSKVIGFGVMYMHRLEHVTEHKLSAIAIEGHGQRIGEQEVWSLMATKQFKFLEEAMIRVDDRRAHQKLLDDLLLYGVEQHSLPDYITDSKVLAEFHAYLNALGLPVTKNYDTSYLDSYWQWKKKAQSEGNNDGEQNQ